MTDLLGTEKKKKRDREKSSKSWNVMLEIWEVERRKIKLTEKR